MKEELLKKLQEAIDKEDSFSVSILLTRLESIGVKVIPKEKVIQ
jgi:hypothetical protein